MQAKTDDLTAIPGLGKTSLELLEAAGFRDADALARAGVDQLAAELARANEILRISKRTPGRANVEKWIEAAREMVRIGSEPVAPSLMPIDYESRPEVAQMLADAPFALPLPSRILVANQLGVADIPAGILLNRYSGDLDVRVDTRLPAGRQPKAQAAHSFVHISETAQQKVEIDTSRIRSIGDMDGALPRVAAVKTSPATDRVALIRAPRSETNKGRDPKSRWYIRGVLHSHPGAIYFGALVTILLMVMVPVAVVSALLLLASDLLPEKFGWVPSWLLWLPVALPLFGFAWLVWGLQGSCRICGQRLFVHRAHRKNVRAHHLRGIGYILPLCLQILVFRWFRCTHCGTPVRLKE